ncbi:MAG: OmpA family protein [Bacteroidota bacterium]
MNSKFLKLSALALGLIVSSETIAQETTVAPVAVPPVFSPSSSFSTWSFGVNAGVLAPTVIAGKNDFTSWKADLGYGAYIKKQIWPAVGIQANFLGGKLKADNSRELGNGSAPVSPYTSYETLVKYSGSLSAYWSLANIYWMNRTNVIQPYLTAGYGLMGYDVDLTSSSGTTRFNPEATVHESFIPVGAGLKFGISNNLMLDLGYQMNFVDGDNLDGYRAGPQSDKFSYTHIGLEFALGGKSKPSLSSYNPVAALEADYIARNAALQADLAAERNKNAAQMAQMSTDWARFKADSDGDGVSDYFDKCPNTPAGTQVDGAGCPIKVTNTTVNPVRVVVTEEDRRVVAEAIKNLEFDFAKATIRSSSYPSLNRVADLLKSKDFSLKLAGHTDNVGSDAANLKLSKDRAESVKSYLVSQGANPSRIEATGYGESQPISTNNTASGRQNNRRVEFTLY